MVIKSSEVLSWLHSTARLLIENEAYLTDLDAAIGDADHGANMARGFGAVVDRLPGVEDADIGTILQTAGMTLISTVGGAAGPLYATLFMRMGTATANKHELCGQDLVAMLDAGVQGVVERGKAQPGEKTMVDSLHPALDALSDSIDSGGSLEEALLRAAQAAHEGMKATIPMKALRGRASYLGERSIGHQDPGATSIYLMLKGAAGCVGVADHPDT